jgi:hypothetical protein
LFDKASKYGYGAKLLGYVEKNTEPLCLNFCNFVQCHILVNYLSCCYRVDRQNGDLISFTFLLKDSRLQIIWLHKIEGTLHRVIQYVSQHNLNAMYHHYIQKLPIIKKVIHPLMIYLMIYLHTKFHVDYVDWYKFYIHLRNLNIRYF